MWPEQQNCFRLMQILADEIRKWLIGILKKCPLKSLLKYLQTKN